MNKVEKVKTIIGTGMVADGSISRDLLHSVNYQSFTGMNLLIEGDDIVFADLGKKSTLSDSMIEEIEDDKAITFRLKDEDGPFKISVVLRKAP